MVNIDKAPILIFFKDLNSHLKDCEELIFFLIDKEKKLNKIKTIKKQINTLIKDFEIIMFS